MLASAVIFYFTKLRCCLFLLVKKNREAQTPVISSLSLTKKTGGLKTTRIPHILYTPASSACATWKPVMSVAFMSCSTSFS